MNPYETPQNPSEDTPVEVAQLLGKMCCACGSHNTGRDCLSDSRPNIVFVIFFGWLFLLIRGAFAVRTDVCRNCGEVNRYKSAGSWVALSILTLLVLAVIAAIVGNNSAPH